MIPFLFILIGCLVLLEAFFSGSEMALISCDRTKIRHLAGEGVKGARVAERLLPRPDRLLATTLVGTNLCVVISATAATLLCLFLLGEGRQYYATLLLTPFKIAPSERDPYITREELKFLVQEDRHQADLDTGERRMIHKIIDFGETTVQEVMIPLIEVVAVPASATVAEAVAVVSEHQFSRIPVFEERIDQIVGIVHAFDLLSAGPETPLAPLIRPAVYVPETKLVADLFQEMRRGRFHMAVVVDEYGGVVGIVTIEDLLEEIVGEIEDEYDEEPLPLKRLPDGSYLVDARLEVERLSDALGIQLPAGEYDTLGGFLLHLFQKIPDTVEEVQYGGMRFVVAASDKRSIVKVRIRLMDRQGEDGRQA